MDFLKKLFPFSFDIKNLANLIIRIVIYAVAGTIVAVLLNYLSQFPMLRYLMWPTGVLTEIYIASGIALAVIDYKNIAL